MCEDETGQRAQMRLTIQSLIVNMIGRAYVITQGDKLLDLNSD